jgi:hypothetical protein
MKSLKQVGQEIKTKYLDTSKPDFNTFFTKMESVLETEFLLFKTRMYYLSDLIQNLDKLFGLNQINHTELSEWTSKFRTEFEQTKLFSLSSFKKFGYIYDQTFVLSPISQRIKTDLSKITKGYHDEISSIKLDGTDGLLTKTLSLWINSMNSKIFALLNKLK